MLRADQWFEEEQPIHVHPKDPYKRVDILPSMRKITVKVDGVLVAESLSNMFLFETLLRPRYYLPKSSVQWQYLTESETVTKCPYKGAAHYYHVTVDGRKHQDLIWWYPYITNESALIANMVCFYNEKVDLWVDGVKEQT